MSGLEIVIASVLAFVTIEQAIAVAIFLVYCRRAPRDRPDEELPEALVVLALRGRDASLPDCLAGLFAQDYPRYRVRVVVDNAQDPAMEVVEQAMQRLQVTHVTVQTLQDPSDRCTLKCSALYQATDELPESVEVVAFLDADVAPHSTWLRELVSPLADESAGASMGNRWYAPRQGRWGSLVRVVWNVGAVINMYFWNIPWGGSLAVKADILRNTDLRERWSKAGCDDVPLFAVLQKLRLKLVFVPGLLLVNREEVDLARCFRFLWRQFLWVRLYQPVSWWVCAVFNYLVAISKYAALVLAVLAVLTERWLTAGVLGGMYVFNHAVTLSLVVSSERHARRALATRGGGNTANWLKIFAAIQLAELVVALAFLYALFSRKVEWRGIQYHVRGPWKIRMVEYRPSTAQGPDRQASRQVSVSAAAQETTPKEAGEV
jgi:glycosyltransferase involved in cell wall biosynthesis